MSTRPGLAAVLSFVIPGLGQIYNGHFIRAAFWLLIAFGWMDNPMAWPFEAEFKHWVVHFLPAMTAYHKARQMELFATWKTAMERKIGGDAGGTGRTFDQ